MSIESSSNVEIEGPFAASVSQKWLQGIVQATLDAEGHDSVACTLVITDDEVLRSLNRDYLGNDMPTDVLSFGGESPDFVSAPDAEPYLGDVIISYPRALAQAETAGHPVEAELALLTVHGVLHLLGYDHIRPDDKSVMWERQANILALLGFEHVSPTEG